MAHSVYVTIPTPRETSVALVMQKLLKIEKTENVKNNLFSYKPVSNRNLLSASLGNI